MLEIKIIKNRKNWLVDVPVRINIWIRPECQRKQFDVIRRARPSILFLQSDGGRNEDEWRAIQCNRKLYDNEIDWNCTVYKIYEDKNNGLYKMSEKSAQIIWSKVDRCIFTEDDQIPEVCFFQFCSELLEKYKDDYRIQCICGTNLLEKWNDTPYSYFFSRQGSIWSFATWRRTYEDRKKNFEYRDSPYDLELLKQRTKHNKKFWKRIIGYKNNDIYENHVAGSEFHIEFSMYGYSQLQIIPKYNLVSNIGTTSNSAHNNEYKLLPKGIRSVFKLRTYNISFPLKHPKYIIPDVKYEVLRNKKMAYNFPVIEFLRKLEYAIRLIINGQIKSFIYKINKRLVKTTSEN